MTSKRSRASGRARSARPARAATPAPQATGLAHEALKGRDLPAIERQLRDALARDPRDVSALNNLGVVIRKQGRPDEAADCYRKALAIQPRDWPSLNNLGNVLHHLRDFAGAIEMHDRAIAARPNEADSHFNKGNALTALERIAEAAEHYRQAVALRPGFYEAHCNLGISLRKLGRLDEAIAAYRDAIRHDDRQAFAWIKLGNVFDQQHRFPEAIDAFERALARDPDAPDASNGLGLALMRSGRPAAAIEHLRRAIGSDPKNAWAHLNLALALLTLGRFEEGWREYEWRWSIDDGQGGKYRSTAGAPAWEGQSLAGRTILLIHEQGLGDTIQCLRYIPVLAAMGAKVIAGVQPPLARIAASVAGCAQVVPTGGKVPERDFDAPFLSLPRLLGTTEATIPRDVPYLAPDPDLIAQWRARLPTDGLKVGLCWAGKPSFQADARRTMSFAMLAPLADIEGVTFVNLQKGDAAAEARDAMPVLLDLMDEVTDFADTAAIIASLDLVVTVDTSVAHLAGAMGRPVWMLCRYDSEWRWLLERIDSPWYPTMSILRQDAPFDWAGVVARVVAGIERMKIDGATAPQDEKTMTPPATTEPDNAAPAATPAADPAVFNLLRDGRHGRILYNRNDQYVGRSIAEYGEFSEGEIGLFRQIVREGDFVLEAGANIGAHTVWFARAVGPQGRVYAYEPQRLVFQVLCANVALNSLANVHAVHAGLGRAPGMIGVAEADPRRHTNFGGIPLGHESFQSKVRCETIDSLELPRLKLLKVDVEGMEAEVLAGAEQTIRRLRPLMYLENDRQQNSPALIRLVRSLGYRMWWHLPYLYNPDNFARNGNNVFGRILSINLLCVPAETNINIADMREVLADDDWWRPATPAPTSS